MRYKIFFRFADEQDLEDLFEWRNQPSTRKYSFQTDEITIDQHKAWFERSLKNPKRNIFIALTEKNEKIGQVRFDRDGLEAEVSIGLAERFMGKGYGTQMLTEACELYFNNYEVDIIIAKIKKENSASVRAFEKSGFSHHSDHESYLEMRLKR